jgi:predicted lipoprotein with Yx(FWY)xxD motif
LSCGQVLQLVPDKLTITEHQSGNYLNKSHGMLLYTLHKSHGMLLHTLTKSHGMLLHTLTKSHGMLVRVCSNIPCDLLRSIVTFHVI